MNAMMTRIPRVFFIDAFTCIHRYLGIYVNEDIHRSIPFMRHLDGHDDHDVGEASSE